MFVQVTLRNPCILHLIAFVLNIAHILLCYIGRIIFLEYDSGLWSIGHYHIWGSVTVSVLFQNYKTAGTPCIGGSYVEISDVLPRWVFLEIWDLAMI